MYFTIGFAFYIFISMALIGLLPVSLRRVLYSKSKRLSLQVRIFFPTPPFLIYPNFALLPAINHVCFPTFTTGNGSNET